MVLRFAIRLFGFKVTAIQEDEDATPSESSVPSLPGLRRPLNVVRKLVTTQRRTSLQRLSSITNLAEVCADLLGAITKGKKYYSAKASPKYNIQTKNRAVAIPVIRAEY